jgi:hypothetical protein
VERVVIAKDKRAGYSIRVSAYVVAEDEFGSWLFTPADSVARYEDGDDILLKPWPNFLSLSQSDEWFWAGWWIRDGVPTIGTDACTPPVLVGDAWSWTDLELDVLRDPSGTWIEDEDELDEAVAAGNITAAEAASAWTVSRELERRLLQRVAPFDDTGWRRHDEALALGLPPLPEPVR